MKPNIEDKAESAASLSGAYISLYFCDSAFFSDIDIYISRARYRYDERSAISILSKISIFLPTTGAESFSVAFVETSSMVCSNFFINVFFLMRYIFICEGIFHEGLKFRFRNATNSKFGKKFPYFQCSTIELKFWAPRSKMTYPFRMFGENCLTVKLQTVILAYSFTICIMHSQRSFANFSAAKHLLSVINVFSECR